MMTREELAQPIAGGDSSAMVAEIRAKSAVRDKMYAIIKDL